MSMLKKSKVSDNKSKVCWASKISDTQNEKYDG